MAYDRRGRVAPRDEQEEPTGPSVARRLAVGPEGTASAPPKPAPPRARKGRVFSALDRMRVLPVLLFVAVLMLSVKVNGVWNAIVEGRSVVQVAAVADAQSTASESTKPSASQPRSGAQLAANHQKKSNGEEAGDAGKGEKPLDPVLFTRSEIELLQELSKRREELDAREQAVIQREGLLTAAEDRIEKKISELQEVKAEINDLIRTYEEQELEQLKGLVAIYEKMKPKDAAKIFNDLEMGVLLDLLDKMKSAKIAPILANMSAQRAKEITMRIAERKVMPKVN